MDRRTLLKGGLTLLLPFTAVKKAIGNMRGVYYSPFLKSLGKAVNINMEQVYDVDYLFEQPFNPYQNFPIEARVTIQYEKGTEVWTGFNMRNGELIRFSLRDFFNSKFVPDKKDFGGYFQYGGVKFRLTSVSVEDGIRMDKF